MKTQLTVQQAIAEGFEYAGIKGEQFQRVASIDGIGIDALKTGKYYLATKEKTHPTINAASLLDLISNQVDSEWYDETHDDDSGVYESLAGIDLTEITALMNESLKKVWNVKITDIQLIP